MVTVTVTLAVLALVTVTFKGTLVFAVASLLNPYIAGVKNCVTLPVLITSAITPVPGVGSVARDLE
jgi:hypothetical protein